MESPYRFVNTPTIEPSNAKAEDKPGRSSRDLLWVWLCWLGVVVMLYVLSSGPFWMLVDKKIIRLGTPSWRAAQIIYWPLDWGCEHTVVRKPLFRYWHFWAPHLYDSKGNKTGLLLRWI